MTGIGRSAFYNCESIEDITIPKGITSISDYTFYGCRSLKSIEIPENVTVIGEAAFYNCESLEDISIPINVQSLGSGVFTFCCSIISITVSENNKYYSSEKGVLFNKDKTELICYPGGKAGQYVVPESVISIGYYAFAGCNLLTNVKIGSNVKNIVKCAFYKCESLENITIPTNVTSLGIGSFASCNSLASITIPKNVVNIGDKAFTDCTLLENVYYTGTKDEWNNILMGTENDPLLNATIHYNYVPTTIPEEITPSVDSNVVVDSDKATVSGIKAGSKPADVIAQFEGSDNIQIVGKDGKVLADDALVGTGCKVQLIENGEVKDEVTVVIKGEIDGNGKIDSDDAIYLLRNTLFASLYPVVVDDDVDGNGEYNSDDAIHLLRHTLFPSMYPLK